jgi:hypothetical protein
MNVIQHGSPLVGEVDLLYFGRLGSIGGRDCLRRLGRSRFREVKFGQGGLGLSGHRQFENWIGLGGKFRQRNFRDRRWGFVLNRSGTGRQFRIGEPGSTLEPATELTEAFGAALVIAVHVNLFELRGQFSGTTVVTRTEDKV